MGVCLLGVGVMASAAASGGQQLHGHVPTAVAALRPVEHLPAAQHLKLAIGLPPRNENALTSLIADLYDPASPSFHQYLTPAQFTEKFGPSEQDYQAVVDFAKANGLTVTGTHPNRLVLDVDGAIPAIEAAFHVTLRNYQHPREGRKFYAPDAEPTLDLATPILHISGLDNYSLPHPNHKIKPLNTAANATPNAGSGPGGAYAGNDFRAAYVPGTALTGAGQSVALLQFDAYYASDIAAYKTQFGLPDVPLVNVPVGGGVSTPGTGNGEVCLDIEMVLSMAPGISAIYVYEAPNPSPWVTLLSKIANDNLAKQVSCSWGGGSPDSSSETIFKQMATQGQSFFNATGDSDAFTGSVPFPSDSPNITEVGATTLSTTGAGGSYISETVWNWGLQGANYIGSSGGSSTYYAIPSWQTSTSMATNQGSTTKRNLPDVALTGDNVYVRYNNGGSGAFGGTSCAAPLWAGFTALVNQQAVANGRVTVGFLNPALYALGNGASYSSTFHDTTTGNNFWLSSPTKFSAVTGYDLCTGWGTPNGTALINALANTSVALPSTTTVTSSLGSTGAYGSSVTFSASVTGTGATATGAVTFIDGSTELGSVILNASGVATFTTSALAVGSHALKVSFRADITYAASTSAAFAYTVSPKPVTITGVTAANKVYDATTSAVLTGGTVSGTISGETVTVIPGSGTFASANAGSQAVTATGYGLSGANAANYVLSTQPSVANATISPRSIQLSGSQPYDGTTVTAAGVLSVANNLDGVNLTLTGNANLASDNVGSQAISTGVARVQSATNTTTAASFNVSLGTAPVTGNTLVAVISTRGTTASRVTSITQTGASWSRAAQATNGSGTTTEIWVASNVSSAGTSVTIAQASALRSAAVVIEYAGILAVGALDQTASATGTSTAAVTGTTPTTMQANELWIGGIGIADGRRTLNTPYSNSFTVVALPKSGSSSSDAMIYALEKFVSATGSAGSGGTLSTSDSWAGAICTFKTVGSLALAGAAAANYTTVGATGSVLITPRPITVTAVIATKTYDGTTAATGTPTLAPPLITGDTTAALSQAFQDSTVGTGNKVIVPSITINDNNGGANYAPTLVNFTTGTILPIPATVTLGGFAATYDGSPKPVTVTTTPSGLSVAVTYNGSTTVPSAAGSYAIVAAVSAPNYTGSASGTLVIAKATATIGLAGFSQTYDGSLKPVSVTTTPVGLGVVVTYNSSGTAPSAAGSYAIAATVSDPNYTGSASGTLVIGKATATIELAGLAQTYDGIPKPVTASTTPASLGIAVTYDHSVTVPTAAGSYAIAATVSDPNYAGSASGTLVIGKATAPIELTGLAQTYDGTPKPVTATTTPTDLTVVVTYDGSITAPSAVGSYLVRASVIDPNHTDSASGTLVIAATMDFATWRDAHFTTAEQNAGLADATADPDSDGLTNLAEYALGTDPHQFTPPPAAIFDSSGLTLTFTRPANLPDVTYIAESSDGLSTWSPVALEVLETGTVETVRARDPLTTGEPSRRFLRLRFELK